MKKIILISAFLFSNIWAENKSELKVDLDNDGKLDKVYFEETESAAYLVCKLSSQKFKKIKSNNIEDYNKDNSSLSKTKSGFKFHNDAMRSGVSFQFRYESKSKKIRLIGAEYYDFGNAGGDGSGNVSINLLTNKYIANWNQWSFKKDKLIKQPTINKKKTYPKFYLSNFVGFSFEE